MLRTFDRYLYILLIIPVILMIIWFRGGLITGGGEEGILFFNTNKTLQLSTSAWIDYMGGIANVNWLSRAPIIYLSTLFAKIGLPLFFFQISLFYLLMITAMLSVYFFAKDLLPGKKNMTAFVAALFYLLNPFTISQIWGRSLYAQYFAFALLPLSLLLFHLGIKKRSYYFSYLIVLSSALMAWAFGFLTFIVVFWLVLLLYLIFAVFISNDKKIATIFGVKFFLLTLILWLLINLWWFLPLVSSFSNVYSEGIQGKEDNLGSLIGVSRSYPLEVIIRLLHKGYFFDATAYSTIYATLPFQLISILPVFFVLIGLWMIIRDKKHLTLKFFAGLFIFGLSVSLGANFPFGRIYIFFFSHISPLQAFRNPFEKFGLVYTLGYSVLFAYGLINFLDKKKFKNVILISILVLNCGIYVWPIWTGLVIAGPDKKIGLDIPQYYKDLQTWLLSRQEGYRLLFTPIWSGDGAFYRWGNAGRYQGFDPMLSMLDSPPISNSSKAPYFGSFLSNIRKKMVSQDVVPALSLLRIKDLVDRKDAIFVSDQEKDQYRFLTSNIYLSQDTAKNLKITCQNLKSDAHDQTPAWIICPLKEEGNFSKIKYLHLQIKTNVPAFLEVTIKDKSDRKIRWDGRGDPEYSTQTDWQNVVIPLGIPTENNYEIDLSKISSLEVQAHPKDNELASVWEINLSGVKLDPGIETSINEYKKVDQFGALTVFEPVFFNPPPEIGSITRLEKLKDFTELFDQTAKSRDTLNISGFLLPSQNLNKNLNVLDNQDFSQILETRKFSETRYWIKTPGTGKNLILLSKTFIPGWILIPNLSPHALQDSLLNDLQLLHQSGTKESNHFVVNGYANLWLVDGRYTQYAVIFMPQIIADISRKISIFSVLCVIGCLSLCLIIKLKKYTSSH